MLTVVFGSAVAIVVGNYVLENRRKAREQENMKLRIAKISKDLNDLHRYVKEWK